MLRFFCPIHEVGFESADEHKILCEITGHTLATDFPKVEVWEFCCNCATFAPSGLGKGETARSHCFSCQNEISRRYLCSECQTVTFECGKKSKGQRHLVATTGVEPDCPACHSPAGLGAVVNHECDEIAAELITARDTCPFCLEGTNVGFTMPGRDLSSAGRLVCPNCKHVNRAESSFCSMCRSQLKSDVDVSVRGSDVKRTPILDSLCPHCSMPVPGDADFCGECGQAVKKANLPPPPPPPPTAMGSSPEAKTASFGELSSEPAAIGNLLNDSTGKVFVLGLGGIIFVILVAIGISSSLTGSSTGNSALNATKSSRNSSDSNVDATRVSTPVSSTPNPRNSDYRIGKTGTVLRDINLRDLPGNTSDAGWVGTHYRGARVRILDVSPVTDSDGNQFDWLKVQVLSTGTSMDANNAGLAKNPGSSDEGWIHSYPTLYNNASRTTYRDYSVKIDN